MGQIWEFLRSVLLSDQKWTGNGSYKDPYLSHLVPIWWKYEVKSTIPDRALSTAREMLLTSGFATLTHFLYLSVLSFLSLSLSLSLFLSMSLFLPSPSKHCACVLDIEESVHIAGWGGSSAHRAVFNTTRTAGFPRHRRLSAEGSTVRGSCATTDCTEDMII